MTENHIFLARQTEGRKAMATKLPSWAENMSILFPVKISLEQCSSEATALYKASLVSGESMVDLTGGFGVDCSFLSKKFSKVDYVEQNEELCQIAEHNFRVLGLNIKVNNAESVEFLKAMPAVSCIYIDPARRDVKGKKTADLSLCSPNLLEIRDILLEKCNTLLIKLSPMFDISSALEVFPECKQVHVVSVKNECKELLLLIEKDFKGEANLICVDLDNQPRRGLSLGRQVSEHSDDACIVELGVRNCCASESRSKTCFDYAERSQQSPLGNEELGVRSLALAILSGAEPQRTIFEKELLASLQNSSHENIILVQGKIEAEQRKTKVGKITVYNFMSTEELQENILKADEIICRSGYSSIMDLYALGKLQNATLIPTPGQTEQEYLAEYISNHIK